MARYLQTELARGVAPDGTRVVSAANLETTWTPGIAVPDLFGGPPQIEASKSRYGLGWMSGEYQGLRVISHAGGTSGFSTEIALLPEADLGIVVMANAQPLAPFPLAFPYAVQFRLFELLFDLPAEFDAAIAALPPVRPPLALGEVDAAAVTPHVGRYMNPELGEVTLSLRDDRLFFATGEITSELRPPVGESGDGAAFLFHDPPLSLYSEVYGVTVALPGGAGAPRLSLTIPANPNGPGRTYEFAPEA
jgi:CubicO group peptidase (beta-lactamase class C family)